MPDAFISYSRRDSREFVERLAAALAARDKDTWVDLEDIPPASKWEQDLREGVASSDAFCFVISPGSVASEHCRRELDYANERNKRIVPINHIEVADAEVPGPIGSHNWVPQRGSFEDDFERSLDTLIEAIETDLEWVRAHTRWGERAEEWAGRGRDRSLLARGSDLVEAEQFVAAAAGRRPEPTELQGEYVVASRAAASKRQRLTVAGVSVALIVSLGLAAFAFFQRQTAIDERQAATSRALAANAFLNLPTDPELSLLLGLEAADAKATGEAEDALRSALLASRVRVALQGHRGSLTSAAFSPDGDSVLTASADEDAGLWDTETGERTAVLDGHKAGISEAVFSEDGSNVLTYAQDATARIWSAEDGSSLAVLEDRDDPLGRMRDAAFSPDGTLVATAPFVNSTVKIWDAQTGSVVGELPQDTVDRLAFSPDGTLLVTADQARDVAVWRAGDGGLVAAFRDDAQSTFSYAGFSPDGDLFATAGADGFARVRRVDGSVVATLEHDGPISDLAFSADGALVATAGEDGVVKVWSSEDGSPITVFDGHRAPVNSVAFSPDGALVASGGGDGRAFLWEATSGSELATLVGHRGPVEDVEFSRDGSQLVTASGDGTARIWTAALGGGAFAPGRESPAVAVEPVFSADGRYLLAEDSGEVSVVATDSREPIGGFTIGRDETLVPALSPGAELVVTTAGGFEKATPQLRRATDGELVAALAAATASAAGFSPDAERVVLAGTEGSAGVYDASSGEELVKLAGHDSAIEVGSAEFSPDGRMVVTSSLDRTARVWDAQTGEQLAEMRAFTRPSSMIPPYATGASFSPDSRLIVTWARFEADAKLWNAGTGELVATLEGFDPLLYDAAFSPSGRFLVTGWYDGTVRLWEGESGRPLSFVTDVPGYVDGVAFTPDEREILMVTSATVSGERPPGRDALRAISCDVCAPIETLEQTARERVTRGFTETERRRFLD